MSYARQELKANTKNGLDHFLASNKMSDIQKARWLFKYFKNRKNRTKENLEKMGNYFNQADRLMMVSAQDLKEMKRLFKKKYLDYWNYLIAIIVNKSELFTTDQKISLLMNENAKGNHEVISQVSRSFYGALPKNYYDLFRPLYLQACPGRWREIEAVRLAMHPEEQHKEIEAITLANPKISPRSSDETDYALPSKIEETTQKKLAPFPTISKTHPKIVIPALASAGAIAGGVVGFLLGGPIGAVILAAAGALLGALVGLIYTGIRYCIAEYKSNALAKNPVVYATPPDTPQTIKKRVSFRDSLTVKNIMTVAATSTLSPGIGN